MGKWGFIPKLEKSFKKKWATTALRLLTQGGTALLQPPLRNCLTYPDKISILIPPFWTQLQVPILTARFLQVVISSFKKVPLNFCTFIKVVDASLGAYSSKNLIEGALPRCKFTTIRTVAGPLLFSKDLPTKEQGRIFQCLKGCTYTTAPKGPGEDGS